jgi:hypothetical protein
MYPFTAEAARLHAIDLRRSAERERRVAILRRHRAAQRKAGRRPLRCVAGCLEPATPAPRWP